MHHNIIEKKKNFSHSKISSIVERFFLFSTCFILVITIFSFLYFNQRSIQNYRINSSKKTHEILSNLITPALNISDTQKVRSLLQLASSKDETFIVINNVGNVLMPDYEKMTLVKSVLIHKESKINCMPLENIFRYINDQEYWINCTKIDLKDIFYQKKELGVLLSFTKSKKLFFTPFLFTLVGTSVFIMVLVAFWFRQRLHHHLAKPLIVLGNRIKDKTKSPLINAPSLGNINNAPYEVLFIKKSFEDLLANLQNEYQFRSESEKKVVLFELAAQVAHDIRSPLAAMEMMLLSTSQYLPLDAAKIQKEIIQCIRDIANNLLNKYREPQFPLISNDANLKSETIFIYLLLELIISHKRQEWLKKPCNINLLTTKKTKFFCIDAINNPVRNMISNLLNNAYEALEDKREINISLQSSKDSLTIKIADTGKGIPENKLSKVLSGESLKHVGKGLGLSSATELMLRLGGNLIIESKENEGTAVTLVFDNMSQKKWNTNSIEIFSGHNVIILDDDPSIHHIWRKKLLHKNCHPNYFTNITELNNWIINNKDCLLNSIYLFDYELQNSPMSGMELLQQLNVGNRGYLITNHSDEKHIQEVAEKIGAWLIPKRLINYVEITFVD